MPQKIKSLLYLSCFIIAAILYYNTDNTNATSSQNDEMVDTHIDEITISSFDDDNDNDEVEEDEEEGKEYSD